MATFKICVRDYKRQGLMPVYIRITHKRKTCYVKTGYQVDNKGLGRHGEVRDTFVLGRCSSLIEQCNERLMRMDTRELDTNDIRKMLYIDDQKGSFTEYAKGYIRRLEQDGHDNNASVYRAALKSMQSYRGSESIAFNEMTVGFLRSWIDSLRGTKRAKALYPICMRQVYREAIRESADNYGDYSGEFPNPWVRIIIPESTPAPKRAVPAELCRLFFSWNGNNEADRRSLMARDTAMMSMCLAGMNSVDIFNLRKENYRDGIIRYKRSKTAYRRSDGAYFEIRVPQILHDVIKRHLADKDSEYLFWFADKYRSAKVFNVTINTGIAEICAAMGIKEKVSFYTFRHTWATTAQNEFGTSLSEIGFAMNHSSGNRVTRGYVKFDFSPAWELNERVVDFIFFSNAPSKQFREKSKAESKEFGIEPSEMVYARAYFRGEVLAEVSDIGFSNVDEVIDRLARQLPDTIPDKCAVQFRIRNLDTDREAVYERTKGKGF